MPRRPSNPAARRRVDTRPAKGRWRFGTVVGAIVTLGLISAWLLSRPTMRQRAIEAESEARKGGSRAEGRWKEALEAWKAINESKAADARSFLGEARSSLALSLAAQAEKALIRARESDPSDPEASLRLLDLYRLEDRAVEARKVGEQAMEEVPERSRREVLKALTLAMLANPPDRVARATLKRFADADQDDLDARLALWRRVETLGERPGIRGSLQKTRELDDMFERNPQHIGVRESLVLAMAEEGRRDRVRTLLDGWPESGKDARFWRLRGRWDLDVDKSPDRAVEAFEKARIELPHDPKIHANLARALHALGRDAEARRQVEKAVQLKELLDPARLGPKLDADLARLDDGNALEDLARLCESLGLDRLSRGWREQIGRKGNLE